MREVKIKEIRAVEVEDIYDIEVGDLGHYILSNGIVSHNTMDMYSPKEQGGGCLTAGHWIMLEDHQVKIEDVKIGDEVLTLSNEYKKVIATHHYKKPTFTIALDENEVIECTEEHKFLVEYEDGLLWVEARNLRKDDEILAIN